MHSAPTKVLPVVQRDKATKHSRGGHKFANPKIDRPWAPMATFHRVPGQRRAGQLRGIFF